MGYTPHILVVGGGVLGTGIARDLAIRGLDVTLVEQGTLAAGTTTRMHGLLYSGARFAHRTPKAAVRCRAESYTLREIGGHCVEETGGLVLTGDIDKSEFLDTCERCDITAMELDADQLDGEFPGVEAEEGGIRVPDAAIDPFRLTIANAESAEQYGATIETGATVVDVRLDDGDVAGVEVEYDRSTGRERPPTSAVKPPSASERAASGEEVVDEGTVDEKTAGEDIEGEGAECEGEQRDEDGGGEATNEVEEGGENEAESSNAAGEDEEMVGEIVREFPGASEEDEPETGEREVIEADYVINATGAWADRLAALAGINLSLDRTRGRMIVLDGAVVTSAVTKLSSEGIPCSLTPYQGNTVLGPVPEKPGTRPEETVEKAVSALSSIVPAVEDAAVLRTYTGVWTQYRGASGSPYGHNPALIDHEKYHDTWGLLTVLGGSVTTHRYVAERAVDRVCSEFGIDRSAMTAEVPLPGSTDTDGSASSGSRLMAGKTGAQRIGSTEDEQKPVLCETRDVTRETVQKALEDSENPTDLTTVRMRTGATMGDCQGGRCGHRIAAELHPKNEPETVEESLGNLLSTRWSGRRETLTGDQLARAMSDYELHVRTLGRGYDLGDTEIESFARPEKDGEDSREQTPDPALYRHASELAPLDPIPTDGERPHVSEVVGR